MIYQIYCEECDSEYQMIVNPDLYQDEPNYCSICGEDNIAITEVPDEE